MERYEEYQPTGVEWMPEIPVHWSLAPLKRLLASNDGGVWGDDPKDGVETTLVLRSTEITLAGDWDLSNPAYRVLTENDIQKARLREGDLLITKSSGSELHIGKTALVTKEIEELVCCFSNFMQRLAPNSQQYSKLMFYFLNCRIAREQFNFLSNTTTGLSNLSGGLLNDMVAPMIPIEEQRTIARFLDDKTAQIDQLITQKKQMLALLGEERAALINRAVTRGLDSDAPVRDSGIEWLGEVPAHWEVKRLKYVAQLINKKVSASDAANLLSLENIESWTGNLTFPETRQVLESDLQEFQPQDVLFCKLRPYLAKVHLASTPGACVGELLVLRSQKEVLPQFLYHRLLSEAFITMVNSSTYGSKMPRASWDFISQMIIPLPPLDEQRLIVNYIDNKSRDIEKTKANINQEISLLQEYRAAIIAEAVTGQIDVRNYESALSLTAESVG